MNGINATSEYTPGEDFDKVVGVKKCLLTKGNHEKPYECGICSKAFSQHGNIKRHLRIHTKEKPYKCELCGKSFTENGSLKRHLKIHTRDKLYGCDTCDELFTQDSNLRTHKIVHTAEESSSSQAKGTNSTSFLTRNEVELVPLACQDEESYKFKTCKIFTRESNFKHQLRIHTGEKLYECDTRGKSFIGACGLNRQIKIHIEEKPNENVLSVKCLLEMMF